MWIVSRERFSKEVSISHNMVWQIDFLGSFLLANNWRISILGVPLLWSLENTFEEFSDGKRIDLFKRKNNNYGPLKMIYNAWTTIERC